MMKAQLRDAGDGLVLQVCGKISEGWVSELDKCWRSARAGHPGAPLSVDLCGVTFIDSAGEDLLKQMHREGASFLTAGVLIREVIHQITGGVK